MTSIDAGVASRLNKELYSLLTLLVSHKGWTYLKAKSCDDGIEAFRYVFVNLTKKDCPTTTYRIPVPQ